MAFAFSKTAGVGMMLVVLGIVCLAVHALFYGGLDQHDVVHDSLFLPLSFLLILLGGTVLCFVLFRHLLRRIR
jgi:hypothetical protein